MAHYIRRLKRLRWWFCLAAIVISVWLLFFDVALASEGIGVSMTLRAWVSAPIPQITPHPIGGNPGGIARILQTTPLIYVGITIMMVFGVVAKYGIVAGVIVGAILILVGTSGSSMITSIIMGG